MGASAGRGLPEHIFVRGRACLYLDLYVFVRTSTLKCMHTCACARAYGVAMHAAGSAAPALAWLLSPS